MGEEFEKKQSQLNSAEQNARQTGGDFTNAQVDVNKERILSAEKAGWWSGAAISLSFTLIGYLVSTETLRPYLKTEEFGIHILYLLIVAWISLLISIIGSVLCRLFNSSFLNYNFAERWASAEKELRRVQLDWIISGYDFVSYETNSDTDAKNNIQESEKGYETLSMIAKKKKKRLLKFTNLTTAAAFAGNVIGILILGLFLILITFNIIWM
ncbi:MAG: hypothetical protein V4576_04390 [Patescibacteria group bacterium]